MSSTTSKSLCKSSNLKIRSSMRGVKRCSSCGEMNGQRAQICNNKNCKLRQKTLAMRLPFDPVELIDNTVTEVASTYYSIRCKERDAQPRNFVHITEVTLSKESQHATIMARKTICFADTCKYDTSDTMGFVSCNHVKACSVDPTKSIPKAEVFTVAREVVWNLNITTEQKQRLWDLYKAGEQKIPSVQRISATAFVVKCLKSRIFPMGYLHVTATGKQLSAKKHVSTHVCACKKLKIIVESDNSVVMQEEICDHILLVLAAILSKPNGKTVYENFTSALKPFWMPTTLELPLLDTMQEDAFFGPSINIGGSFGDKNDQSSADDIFIFGEEFEMPLPDLGDVILDITPEDMLSLQQITDNTISGITATSTSGQSKIIEPVNCAGDPNLVSSCDSNEKDQDMQLNSINSISSATTVAACLAEESATLPDTATHMELSDCNIELMDQFQLTDQIDLCSDDISLPALVADQSNLFSVLQGATVPLTTAITNSSADTCLSTNISYDLSGSNTVSKSLLKPKTLTTASTTSLITADPSAIETTLPPIELPTIAVVKKYPVKASSLVTEVKTRLYPPIPAKRALIVNTPKSQTPLVGVDTDINEEAAEPSLAYSAWLEYVIEIINDSVEIVDEPNIKHSFHVHEEIFSHFSKQFSVGIKRRMPNFTTLVKNGKYKGLIKYTWYFTTASTVRRIFNTKNVSITLERIFERTNDGLYIPYIRATNNNSDEKHKRIYPKVSLYMAHIWFECKDNKHKSFKIEWLPNAFPKSHFGILNIEFSLDIKYPNLVIKDTAS
ncbi:uncharacterized protein LOC119678328 [Teleopsis dalmanni]|uniref:uncharacterized protein LOC119678328 n=1 Tax=Teleopsis dalmanni TaxID=139649 RepID=UPI0018CE0089|nr:uncharacterized protein LOC119678328 [Teleopsis dalmanni]